jgi:hypothetical protein
MRWTRLGLTTLVLGFGCSSGGGGGGALPDAGTGGSGGSGGSGKQYPLTLDVSDCKPGGQIHYTLPTGDGDLTGATIQVNAGAAVTLAGVADPDSVFLGWTGDCSGQGPCALTMDGSKTATAEFGPKLSKAVAWNYAANDNHAGVGVAALGPDGQVAVSISFNDQVDIGGGTTLTAPSGFAIVNYDANGAVLWSKLWAAREWTVLAMRWIGGDVVAVGTRLKPWSMDGVELDGVYRDAMFARLDGATGSVKAAVNATPDSSEEVQLAAISPDGKMAILGDYGGTVNLGGSDLVENTSVSTNEWVASFDAGFVHQWSTAISGDNTFSETHALDVSDAGEVAVGGSVQETLTVGGQQLSNSPESESPYVARFDSTGALGYAKVFSVASSSNDTNALRFASNGELVVAMTVQPSIDIGAGALDGITNTTGRKDLLLARFGATGNVIWNRRVGTEGLESDFSMALEGDEISLTGEFSGQTDGADFGTGLVRSAAIDVLVGQFSATDGTTEWVRAFGCKDWDRAGFVTASGTTVCFTGSFHGEVEYGGDAPLTGDVYVPLVCATP